MSDQNYSLEDSDNSYNSSGDSTSSTTSLKSSKGKLKDHSKRTSKPDSNQNKKAKKNNLLKTVENSNKKSLKSRNENMREHLSAAGTLAIEKLDSAYKIFLLSKEKRNANSVGWPVMPGSIDWGTTRSNISLDFDRYNHDLLTPSSKLLDLQSLSKTNDILKNSDASPISVAKYRLLNSLSSCAFDCRPLDSPDSVPDLNNTHGEKIIKQIEDTLNLCLRAKISNNLNWTKFLEILSSSSLPEEVISNTKDRLNAIFQLVEK